MSPILLLVLWLTALAWVSDPTQLPYAASSASSRSSGLPPPPTPARGSPSLETDDVHMQTYKGGPLATYSRDVRLQTPAKGYSDDVRMMTSRAGPEGGLKPWERELVESAEVKRKATVAQLCE